MQNEDQITGEVPDLKPEELISPLSVFEEYTDEEILYWATPYFDELQAKKEAMREAAKQDSGK
jgi:hypothetical protein